MTQWINGGEETTLTDEQFAAIAAFADAPPPAPPKPTDDEIDQLIASLAATLKKPNVALETGKIKIAVYRKMLASIPLIALQHATRDALATLQWMPTPAEMLVLAKRHVPPEIALHGKAQGMTRARRQRLFIDAQRAIKDRTADLLTLSTQAIRWGIMEGHLTEMAHGVTMYRAPVTQNVERPIAREMVDFQHEGDE